MKKTVAILAALLATAALTSCGVLKNVYEQYSFVTVTDDGGEKGDVDIGEKGEGEETGNMLDGTVEVGGEDISANEKDTSEMPSDTVGELDAAEFAKRLNGIWADLDTASSFGEDEAVFDFRMFDDGVTAFGRTFSEIDRPGDITRVEKLSETEYSVTVNYPEIEMYEEIYPEDTATYLVRLEGDTLEWADSPNLSGITFTFMGDDLESATDAVREYLERTGRGE